MSASFERLMLKSNKERRTWPRQPVAVMAPALSAVSPGFKTPAWVATSISERGSWGTFTIGTERLPQSPRKATIGEHIIACHEASFWAPAPWTSQNKTDQARLLYRHDGGTFCVSEPINGERASSGNRGTIGFRCASPEQVRQFYDIAVAKGGVSIEDQPGLRELALGTMDLAYVRDPDGNKLCAMHLHRPLTSAG